MIEKRFKVIETITYDDRRVYELTKNDIGCYNFKGEKLLAHMICNELNILLEENEQLKQKLKKYEKIEELKKEGFTNCHNCKNDRGVHYDDTTDGMCAIDELMNLDGCFDTEYHNLPSGTICPYWELEE